MMNLKPDVEATSFTAASGARILIVDDEPVAAGMLGVTLAAAGFQIVEVNSGEEALAILAGAADMGIGMLPDIVFLDVEMWGGIDGFEVCRQIKSKPETSQIPVIFLTSKSDAASEQLGF